MRETSATIDRLSDVYSWLDEAMAIVDALKSSFRRFCDDLSREVALSRGNWGRWHFSINGNFFFRAV
jgi:hypothetical protein